MGYLSLLPSELQRLLAMYRPCNITIRARMYPNFQAKITVGTDIKMVVFITLHQSFDQILHHFITGRPYVSSSTIVKDDTIRFHSNPSNCASLTLPLCQESIQLLVRLQQLRMYE